MTLADILIVFIDISIFFVYKPKILAASLAQEERERIRKKMTIPTTGLQNLALCSVFTLFFGKSKCLMLPLIIIS